MLQILRTKIGISFLLALVIIGYATVLKLKNPSENSELEAKVGIIAKESIQNALKNGEIDTTDWEKTLLSLSTSSIEAQISTLQAESTKSEEKLTPTDRFSRDFFSRYIELKESGTAIDENTGITLINELLSQDYGEAQADTFYTEADISVSKSSAAPELRKYGNNLGAIFQIPLPEGYENEIAVIERIGAGERPEDFDKLALNIERYESMREKILDLSVPFALKNVHLAIINSLSAMIDGIQGVILIQTDPVGATERVMRYEDGLTALPLVLESLKNHLKASGVAFSRNESGYVLTQ
jgi:hypothetical protein